MSIAIHRAGNTNVSCADEINHSLDNALNAIEAATLVIRGTIQTGKAKIWAGVG